MGRFSEVLRKGMLAPIKALLPKNPWLRVLAYALPVVLLLALFGPAVDVLLKLFELGLRVLEPMLDTVFGRVLLVLITCALAAMVAVLLLRSRVRELRAEAILGRHLGATSALVGLDRVRCKEQFRLVARYRGPLPQRYSHVVQDAHLKLARIALSEGEVDEALGCLARVVEPGLPKELHRSMLQLRLEALQRQGQVLPATLRREAEAALAKFRGDVAVLRVLRTLSEAEGDLDESLRRQEQITRHAAPADQAAERQRYADMLASACERALQMNDHAHARKLAKLLIKTDPEGASGALMLGDVHLATGDLRKAVQSYGRALTPEGLDRIAGLLADHPGAIDPRELLINCPMQGALLVVARELAKAGEHGRAERAARMAADALGPTPTVCAVLVEVLDLLGDAERAKLLREQTVARLLRADLAGSSC